MSWVYSYQTDSVDLLDYCDAVVIENEGGSGKRGSNLAVGFLDGERWEPKNYGPLDLVLKTTLKYSNASGLITHVDGAAGHVFENLSEMKKLMTQPGLKYLTRTAPDYGSVRAAFEMIGPPLIPPAERIAVYWPLRVPSGSWQTVTQSTATGNPPAATTGGNRQISDPELVFSGAGTFTYTAGDGQVYQVSVATGPTFPVTLTNDNGEWVATATGGADAAPYVTAGHPAVLVLDPDSALSISTTVSVTLRWRNRWG